jgi:hypothetical protein
MGNGSLAKGAPRAPWTAPVNRSGQRRAIYASAPTGTIVDNNAGSSAGNGVGGGGGGVGNGGHRVYSKSFSASGIEHILNGPMANGRDGVNGMAGAAGNASSEDWMVRRGTTRASLPHSPPQLRRRLYGGSGGYGSNTGQNNGPLTMAGILHRPNGKLDVKLSVARPRTDGAPWGVLLIRTQLGSLSDGKVATTYGGGGGAAIGVVSLGSKSTSFHVGEQVLAMPLQCLRYCTGHGVPLDTLETLIALQEDELDLAHYFLSHEACAFVLPAAKERVKPVSSTPRPGQLHAERSDGRSDGCPDDDSVSWDDGGDTFSSGTSEGSDGEQAEGESKRRSRENTSNSIASASSSTARGSMDGSTAMQWAEADLPEGVSATAESMDGAPYIDPEGMDECMVCATRFTELPQEEPGSNQRSQPGAMLSNSESPLLQPTSTMGSMQSPLQWGSSSPQTTSSVGLAVTPLALGSPSHQASGGKDGHILSNRRACGCCGQICCVSCSANRVFVQGRGIVSVCLHCYSVSSRIKHVKRRVDLPLNRAKIEKPHTKAPSKLDRRLLCVPALSWVVAALRRYKHHLLGKRAAVVGLGETGLLACHMLRQMGALEVIGLDVTGTRQQRSSRVDLALSRMSATRAICWTTQSRFVC